MVGVGPFWNLFHREWGKALDALDYDKTSWNQMQVYVEQLEAVAKYAKLVTHNPAKAGCSMTPDDPLWAVAFEADTDQLSAAWEDLERALKTLPLPTEKKQ